MPGSTTCRYGSGMWDEPWLEDEPGAKPRPAWRLGLEIELRHALKRDEFRLVYQPELDCGYDRIFGVRRSCDGATRTAESWLRATSSRWPRRPA